LAFEYLYFINTKYIFTSLYLIPFKKFCLSYLFHGLTSNWPIAQGKTSLLSNNHPFKWRVRVTAIPHKINEIYLIPQITGMNMLAIFGSLRVRGNGLNPLKMGGDHNCVQVQINETQLIRFK